MDIRAGPAAGFRGRFGHPAQCRRISRGTGPGFPALQAGLVIQRTTLWWLPAPTGGPSSVVLFPIRLLVQGQAIRGHGSHSISKSVGQTPLAPSGDGAGRSPPGVCKSAWSPSRRPGSVARWVGWGSSMVLANLLGLPRRRPCESKILPRAAAQSYTAASRILHHKYASQARAGILLIP